MTISVRQLRTPASPDDEVWPGIPGLFTDIPEDQYHGDSRALAQSGAQLILKAPAKFRWSQDHPEPPKDVFDFGSAAHSLVLGIGPKITVVEVEVTATRNGRKVKIIADNMMFRAAQEEAERIRKRGEIPLLPADYEHVVAMADRLSEHRLAMELLSEGRAEVSAYAQDPDTGVMMRGRFDWLGPQTITDYKTASSADPDEFVRHAINYGYDLQAAWYLDLAELCGHPVSGFAHIVQEKQPPYIVTVVVLPPELIDRGHRLKRRALEMYRDCVEAGVWPGYVSDDTFATPAAPAWALREVDEW